jgi:DNA-binding MarR family transcriptional regulator
MDEARWLDEREQEAWRTYMYASRLLWDSLDRQLQRDAGMPHTYYGYLAVLSEAPGRSMTMSRIAEITRSSPSKLSHAMARLEEGGLVHRQRCSGNGRQILATLTDQGHEALTKAAAGHVEHVRAVLFDQLTPEQVRQLRDIFQAVLRNLEEVPTGCAPLLGPASAAAEAERSR